MLLGIGVVKWLEISVSFRVIVSDECVKLAVHYVYRRETKQCDSFHN